MDSDVARRLDAAIDLAALAGLRVLAAARSGLRTDTKPDGSPVTNADLDAERFLAREVASRFPHDGFLGEEFGETHGTSGFRWIVDPIDGTRSFISGVPLYATLIGVEHAGRVVAGVIEMPAIRQRVWAGIDAGAWHQAGDGEATPARVSTVSSLRDACSNTTSLDYFRRAGLVDAWLRVQQACAASRGWSDAFGLLLLATGRVDVVVEPVMHPWDIAAALPILEEAGGRVTSVQGGPALHSGSCLATNALLHDQVLRLLAG